MTAPNLPLSAEDLDIIEFNTDQDADDLTYLVDPRYFERIMTQSRTALDLAAQVAQARRGVALAKAYHHFEQMFADGSRAEWVAARKALDATYASYVKHLARHPGGRAVGGV